MPRPTMLYAISLAVLSSTLLGTPQIHASPSSATLRWGFEGSGEFGDVPALAVTWPVGKGLSMWGGASYIRETPGWVFASGEERGSPHIRYAPVTLGLRIRRVDDGGRRGGPFIEAGPSLAPAWYQGPDGRTGFAMMGGFQIGAGIRLGAFDGSRTEFGLSYYLAEAFGEERDGIGRIGRPQEMDVSLATAYVAVGFGD